ncbi:peptidase family m13 domain-containing protein [Ditylenchus destructor]|nr:peptidase family m13 domain-containing protein [Ditylenchus destructor]
MDRALSDDSSYFTAEQVYNYLNYRVIVDTHQRLGDYEVFPNLADKFGSIPVIRRKSLGRPRFEENLHTYYGNNWLTNISDAEITCTNYVQMYLPELANRVYLDNVFPGARKDATGLRDKARIIVENVALAWKEMINQLSWLRDLPPWEKMAPGRDYALNKITQMVRNVGFNDSILDDDYLHEKYRQLGLNYGFHGYLEEIKYLTLSQQWVTLISGDNSQTRQSFDGYLTMARSWYNPQLNSITIPFALLQPPFFDVDYPSVVNYAFLGSEVGKAIAQAFDRDGQQFDGIGSMVRWMTWLEKDYYYEMVDCLADQYGAFCPLEDGYSPFDCVDAGRTMKSILAENGGTRAAFLAYKNSQGAGDVDYVIPNNLARQYSNDQLFFLAFAQSKCEYKPEPDNTWSKFALSSGFPREYSVLGTLQNMPEFRTIFNCPVGSTYAPRADTCNVWTSEVKPVTGAPPTTTTLPPINIYQQNWWYPDAYAELSDQLEHNIDASRSPCTNANHPYFYTYACGSSSDYRTPLERATFNAYRVTQRALSNTDRREIEPVEMAKRFYSMCSSDEAYNNTFAMLYYNGFKRASRLPFPAFDRPDAINWPSPQQLGRGIGFLSGQAFMDTLLSFKVDTNWVDPDGTEPYLLYVDQSNLWYSLLYYKNTTWESEDYWHNDTVRWTLYNFANLTNTNVSWDEIQVAADDFLHFEQSLANNFITDKTVRDRNYTRSFNLVTVSEANQKYPFFDFHEYFMALVIPPGASRGTVDNRLANKISNQNFKFVTMEPNQLQNMNNAFRDNNEYGFTPRQLLNYLYVRVILENSEYIERPQQPSDQPNRKLSRKFLNRFASRINPNAKFTERSVGSIEHDGLIGSYDCVKLTISAFEYPTARLFIDALSAQVPNIDNLLQSAQGLFSNVVYAFRTMLDQIIWMTPLERAAAEAKLDNMVISFGYPERIRDDRYLFAYYRSFRPRSTSNFVSFAIEIAKFNYAKKFSYLLRTNGVDRQEFNGLIFEPSSWYQPQLNSLVLSATLVLPPFYKPDGPDAVNYGGIGFFIGRALVQAFGDVGVQFDESGTLAPWLGQESSQNLLDQSQCLIQKYETFCPINDRQYNLRCVDGDQTLSENIADSGGLIAAFRAYRNHVEAQGGTNSLPGNLVSQFTGDQLFFLSFAQPFCQAPLLDYRTFEQYLLPGVVPPQYRVTGAVLNNHAFQDAFLCLAEENPMSSYSACNIWITDSPARQQIPPPSLVNIATPRTIKKDEMLFDDYRDAQSYFKASMNLKADPCNNFYEYTCANYQGPLGFKVITKDNYKNIAKMIDRLRTNTASSAVNKLKLFFNTCVSALGDFANRIRDGKAITDRIQKFAQSSTFTFTLMSSPDVPITEKLDSATLAKAIVYLSSNESIDTLLTVVVDGTLDNSINDYVYRLFIDQNTLTYPKAYYTDAAWKVTRPKFLSNVATVLRRYARLVGASTSDNAINTYAGRIVDFEKLLASPLYSTDDITRRDISRWENEWELPDANQNMPDFDWRAYISAILDFAGIPSSDIIDHIYTYFREPDRFKQLAQDLSDTTKIDPDLVVNYLFTRILIQNAQLVPDPDSNAGNQPNSGFVLVKTDDRQFVHEKLEDRLRPDPFVDIDLAEPRLECVKQTVNMMKLANAKVFTDNQFPPQAREDITRSTHNIFRNVQRAFRAMIDDVDWIQNTEEKAEKTGVLAKATNVQMNLGYDDFQITDAQLDEHYTPLFLDDGSNEPFVPDNYFAMVVKLKQFNQFSKWKLIDDMNDHHLYIARSQFVGAPANLESWYSRINNSITIPEGLLREPYYNQNWPTSVNYGSMGYLIAHEFSHALDDMGVQFNSDGIFSRQLTDENLNNFTNMAKCVVDEYNNFKVLDENRYSPNTINGAATQGENIADSAGLRAAFRAYRNHVALNGPDPQLPDRMLRQLTHDQLFFLSFAKLWCQGPPSDDEMYRHILSESHSPPQYRVFGAIQNNPAFRSAFNCPLGSAYAPENYCKVWTPINAN